MFYQHAAAAEAHHAESTLEHEALKVGGWHLLLQGFGAVTAVRFLGLPLGVMHALHVLTQFILPLMEGERETQGEREERV